MDKHKHFSNKQNPDTGWDKVAKWYDKLISEKPADFHHDLIIPGVIKMLDPKRGQRILDIGCGQGILCRELAKHGVWVTGIDVSKKLISIAKSKSSNFSAINYVVADAVYLNRIENESFDAVCSVLAIQNMDDLDGVVRESARVLKKNGRLVWALNHPCFRIPRQTGWGYDEKRKLQYRRIDRYMSPLKIPIQMHPGASPDIYTWTFHRPLSEYFDKLTSCGLAVTKLEEWVSNRKSQPGKNAKSENMSRAEIPLFLALSAVKL